MRIRYSLLLALVLCFPLAANAQDLEGVKCLVDPAADAVADFSSVYMEATVYFCCGDCKTEFEGNPDAWVAAANYQLAATGQFVQKACPFSGGPLAEDTSSEVGGMTVGFCCANCKANVDGAADQAARQAMLFNAEAFEKGFKRASEVDLAGITCMMMDEEVSAEYFVEFNEGKIYFCCDSCVEMFNEDPESYTTAANWQLFQTGQYAQTSCPFSGRAVGEDMMVDIGDKQVGFCNAGCQAKVQNAADDSARIAMVFGADTFAQGFAKVGDQE
ncbi:MAG: hypothetical protein ACR2NP_16260 [Pirellulaceae bacterium]